MFIFIQCFKMRQKLEILYAFAAAHRTIHEIYLTISHANQINWIATPHRFYSQCHPILGAVENRNVKYVPNDLRKSTRHKGNSKQQVAFTEIMLFPIVEKSESHKIVFEINLRVRSRSCAEWLSRPHAVACTRGPFRVSRNVSTIARSQTPIGADQMSIMRRRAHFT